MRVSVSNHLLLFLSLDTRESLVYDDITDADPCQVNGLILRDLSPF